MSKDEQQHRGGFVSVGDLALDLPDVPVPATSPPLQGPMLKALTRLAGGTIHLPNRAKDRPDRDRLAWRFERFKGAA